ncbi:MAG: sulfoxide reductase heme-binding subunit YedZ [Methylococcales bacterium]|nr:sulfoxide reductase heme-binding subunit YedZ [Methylococcales bacterium]
MRTQAADKYWWLIFGCGLLPLLALFADIAADNLGGNPIQAIHIRLGDWTLRFLCLTLAVTPLQTVSRWRGMSGYRQLLGLYTWFYATLHVLAYVVADQGLQWRAIVVDIYQSPYIWFGVLAYMIVLALGLTTSNWAKRRLGKNWKKLHRLIYPAGIAAVIHYFWQLKGNLAMPVFYAIVIVALLGFRLLVWFKNRHLNRLLIPLGRKTGSG